MGSKRDWTFPLPAAHPAARLLQVDAVRTRFHEPGMSHLGFGLPYALALKLQNAEKVARDRLRLLHRLARGRDPPCGRYRAQWNDDYHHAWHVLLTGETQGYYGDHTKSPMRDVARALASGFVYQGEASAYRGGQLRGEPSGKLSPTAFVNFLQNHDQIGNRALGDRLESAADVRAIEAGLTVLLLAPSIPLLFMGEEWGSKAPFPFFCDFGGDLADAVRKGRRIELAWAYEEYGDEVPDALARSSRDSAVLDWNEPNTPAAQKRLTLVRNLLKIRRQEIVPRLANATFGEAYVNENRLLAAHWRMGDGATLRLLANLSEQAIRHEADKASGTLIWGSELGDSVPPWTVLWRIG